MSLTDDVSNHMDFHKTQSTEIEGSFQNYNGVSNTNSAAGNMNSQKAFTSISIGSIGSTGGVVKKVTSY